MSEETCLKNTAALDSRVTGNIRQRNVPIAQVRSPLRGHPDHVHDANAVRVGLLCGCRLAVSVRCLSENLTRKVLRLCEFSSGVEQQVCIIKLVYSEAEQGPEGTYSQMVAVAALLGGRNVPPLSHHGSLSARSSTRAR